VSSDETERLIKMEEVLHGRVIGQEEAVSAISRAIRRARVGLKNPNRPIASFIFAGPTGVGKSELAKTLANYYFGSEEAMVGGVSSHVPTIKACSSLPIHQSRPIHRQVMCSWWWCECMW
jgi:replication-associated recombination protein RarA